MFISSKRHDVKYSRKRLPTLAAPPLNTITMFEPTRIGPHDSYSIRFMPYGMSPSGTLFVKITTAKARSGTKRPFAFSGHNVDLDISSLKTPPAVQSGGKFTGTMAFQPEGDYLRPALINVARER